MEVLNQNFIIQGLGGSIFKENFHLYSSIPSTNARAGEMASKGAPEGSVVIAEDQTAGRGRMGREWLSKGAENLLFSILLRPALEPAGVFVLTMTLALASIDAIKKETGLRPMIKWPNDLFVGEKKLAGILTEFVVKEKRVDYVILGLGLNVNWKPDKEADGENISRPATSIRAETGRMVSRNNLLVEILRTFEGYYREVLSGRSEGFYKRWNELSMIMGREVEIVAEDEKFRGRAVRIDRSGALIIKDNKGKERRVLAGDVSVVFR